MRRYRATEFARGFRRRTGSVGVPIFGAACLLLGVGCASPGAAGEPTPQSGSASAGGPLPGGGFASRPEFGATVNAAVTPPPISGGTLLATRDGALAVAADPERDSLYVVDLATQALKWTIRLNPGDEPGRLAEDGAGRVHAALRTGGALVTIDPARGAVIARQDVCPAPRGIAWEAATDLVWVACATGELVALPAAGGAAAHSYRLERDLRDVVVGQDSLLVTTFRSAQVLHVSPDGTVSKRDSLPSPVATLVPHVAWRALPGPAGTLIAVHQAESTTSLQTKVQGGYSGGGCSGVSSPAFGGGLAGPFDSGPPIPFPDDAGPPAEASAPQCLSRSGASYSFALNTTTNNFGGASPCGVPSSAVAGVLTALGPDGKAIVNALFDGVLPVDVAISADGNTLAAVAPGNAFSPALDTVFIFDACGAPAQAGAVYPGEQPVAVTFAPSQDLLVQTREPAELLVVLREPSGGATGGTRTPIRVRLSDESRADTGHDIFHTQAGGMIACASCHPEGRDDGHVWLLDGSHRRTPSLLGSIAGTAPYHWPGDEPDLNTLVNDVYTVRMSGAALADDQRGALNRWVQAIPAPAAAAVDPSAAARGQALFNRADVGCAKCHSGPKFTDNRTVDVGTGGSFQVPPLVGVGWRTPLMHDGCATTLADRFGKCATRQHGSTASLSAGQVNDLIAYLETL